MNYLVVLVVENIEHFPEILDAWEEAGVTGVTILASAGLGKIRRAVLRDDMPLMPSLQDLLEGDEIQSRILLSVVDSQELVDKLVALARQIIGDLDEPHTGFMFVVPVVQAYGYGKHRMDRSQE